MFRGALAAENKAEVTEENLKCSSSPKDGEASPAALKTFARFKRTRSQPENPKPFTSPLADLHLPSIQDTPLMCTRWPELTPAGCALWSPRRVATRTWQACSSQPSASRISSSGTGAQEISTAEQRLMDRHPVLPRGPGVALCMCNPNTGDPDTGGSLGLTDSQPRLIGELRVPVRDCASEKSRCLVFLRVISEADLCLQTYSSTHRRKKQGRLSGCITA
ncbi:uncharacterized protein LOC121452234 [Microtus oregoni]|uniref:uncharacterized protein LOC121452234 n=1 Tax=Microtus oregoni TaxID=111838 RepID=UPI001BB29FAB|nr:uncharacterized protein LOC121452234 [Microtus oregoni]